MSKFTDDIETRLLIIGQMIGKAGLKERRKLQSERAALEVILQKAKG